MIQSPQDILKKYWGYEAFRPLQEDIIRSVLRGKDTLALLPTGGGKSICFQVPALCQPGVCIVISPLIALMKDQVHNLQKAGVKATAIYSGLRKREIDIAFDNCVHGDVKLLYLSPERLQTELAIERIKRMNVNLLAVDEAHCISQWGYDFRPAYLKIAEIREILKDVPIMALTATATPRVVDDIQEKLNFEKKNVLQKSFYRPNLAYVLRKTVNKRTDLLNILKKVKGSGIVYVNSRRQTKDVAKFLVSEGISADYYHAGLTKDERSQKQDDWINNQRRIMVATNAFGMGIDHPHVRIVVHLQPSASLEAYFQEAGRGGRDGEKAFAILLHDHKDLSYLKTQLEAQFPPIKFIKQVYQALGSFYQLAVGASSHDIAIDFEIAKFCEHYKFDIFMTYHALKKLEEADYIYLTDAVFFPAKIFVKVNREKLYDFLLKKSDSASVLRALLRVYQGVQDQAVKIDEYRLASLLQTNRQNVQKQLQYLSTVNMLDYFPAKEDPQITFIGGRLPIESVYIDAEWYNQRKAWKFEMLDAVKKYVHTHECRSRQLLAYFGESTDRECGICDYCINKKRREEWASLLPEIETKVKEILSKAPVKHKDILLHFSTNQHNVVNFVLQSFAEEDIIMASNEYYALTVQED